MMKNIRLAVAIGMLALALVPATAQAKHGGGQVKKSGKCAINGTWKLKASKDDGRIETDFEVDQNRVGRSWKVTLKHNGHRFFKDVRKTTAPSGSFEVRKFANDAPGTDKIVAKATNLKSGNVCKGTVKI